MRSIGYVPQKINLTGKTLRENITFRNNKDKNKKIKIEDVIEITLLKDLVKRCNGLDSNILPELFFFKWRRESKISYCKSFIPQSGTINYG